MEYILIEQNDDGIRRRYEVYRDVDLTDMSQINRLTELIASVVMDSIEAASDLYLDRPYTQMDTTPHPFGAEIRVMPEIFTILANDFNAIARDCVNKFRFPQLAFSWDEATG